MEAYCAPHKPGLCISYICMQAFDTCTFIRILSVCMISYVSVAILLLKIKYIDLNDWLFELCVV